MRSQLLISSLKHEQFSVADFKIFSFSSLPTPGVGLPPYKWRLCGERELWTPWLLWPGLELLQQIAGGDGGG